MLCHWEERLESKGTKKKNLPFSVFSIGKNNFWISLFSQHFQSVELTKKKKHIKRRIPPFGCRLPSHPFGKKETPRFPGRVFLSADAN